MHSHAEHGNEKSLMSDFEEKFGSLSRVYGDATLQKVRHFHICIVGMGGVGSWSSLWSMAIPFLKAIPIVRFIRWIQPSVRQRWM